MPPISIEQFAAFLDGNLPESEMNLISSQIEANSFLKEIYQDAKAIDVTQPESSNNSSSNIISSDYNLEEIDIPIIQEIQDNRFGDFLYGWMDAVDDKRNSNYDRCSPIDEMDSDSESDSESDSDVLIDNTSEIDINADDNFSSIIINEE